MPRPKNNNRDWTDIHLAYTTTDRTRGSIQREFKISSTQLRVKADKEGWVRPCDTSPNRIKQVRTPAKVSIMEARAFMESIVNEGSCCLAAKCLYMGVPDRVMEVLHCSRTELREWTELNMPILIKLNHVRNMGELNDYLATTIGKWKFLPKWHKDGRIQSLDQD